MNSSVSDNLINQLDELENILLELKPESTGANASRYGKACALVSYHIKPSVEKLMGSQKHSADTADLKDFDTTRRAFTSVVELVNNLPQGENKKVVE